MQEGSFKRSIEKVASGTYWMALPKGYEHDRISTFPLLLFLHGAGERGNDLNRVKIHGPLSEIEKGREFPFIVVAPQCPEGEIWDPYILESLLDKVIEECRVDLDRVYVTGLSMGGYGTWALAMHQPNRFAAIAPICGGANPVGLPKIKHLPIWVRHGDQDDAIPISESHLLVDRLKGMGAERITFEVVEGGGHNVWTELYASDAFYAWLLAQKR